MSLRITPNESNQTQKHYVLNSSDYMKFNKRQNYMAGSRSMVLEDCGLKKKRKEPAVEGPKGTYEAMEVLTSWLWWSDAFAEIYQVEPFKINELHCKLNFKKPLKK